VGSGGTFGFPEITEHARTLERCLKAGLDGEAGIEDGEIDEAMAKLRGVMGGARI
jgi:hypothetical protein